MEGRGYLPARMASSDGYYLPSSKEDIIRAIIDKKVQ
jgi:hypothetical protein